MHASGEYSSKCPWPRHWLYDGWPLMLGGGLKAEKTFGIFLFSFKLNIFGVIGDFRTSIYPVHTIVITLLYHQRQMYFPLWCDEVLFLKLLPKELVTVKSTDTSSPSLASFLVVISYLKPLWVISQTFLRPARETRDNKTASTWLRGDRSAGRIPLPSPPLLHLQTSTVSRGIW